MNLSRLFHCSVIKVLCSLSLRQLLYFIKSICLCQQLFYFSLLSFQATACLSYHQRSALSTTFFIFLCCRFKQQPVYFTTGDRLCQQLFSSHPEVFQELTVASHAARVLTFLLSVPPHQRQLAYNSTAAGRSQHISGGFVEVGHLAVFTAIV